METQCRACGVRRVGGAERRANRQLGSAAGASAAGTGEIDSCPVKFAPFEAFAVPGATVMVMPSVAFSTTVVWLGSTVTRLS